MPCQGAFDMYFGLDLQTTTSVRLTQLVVGRCHSDRDDDWKQSWSPLLRRGIGQQIYRYRAESRADMVPR